MENYSDGLEFLIKSHICIADEFELKKRQQRFAPGF